MKQSAEDFQDSGTEEPDIHVQYSWDWDSVRLPDMGPAGTYEHSRHFDDGNIRYFLRNGTRSKIRSCTTYDSSMRAFHCVINEKPFGNYIPPNITGCFNLLPLVDIWAHYGILLFHASQICYHDKGIVLTASSGTGKTTQAKLWRDCRGARIVCNDRTLVRKVNGNWLTYGYYADGAEPVHSNAVNTLGALVCLRQAEECSIEQLGIAKGLACLMPQLALDPGNDSQHAKIRDLVLELMETIPVFRLSCTRDERAVEELESALKERKIIGYGKDI